MIIRTLIAVFIGGVIGLERSKNHKPAGLITHALVCVGASTISILQLLITNDTIEYIKANPDMAQLISLDTVRITAQVVSGIGFLGAGTIFMNKDKVQGITTAATIWIVAIIGLVIGYGYYKLTFIVFIAIVFIMIFLRNAQRFYNKHRKKVR